MTNIFYISLIVVLCSIIVLLISHIRKIKFLHRQRLEILYHTLNSISEDYEKNHQKNHLDQHLNRIIKEAKERIGNDIVDLQKDLLQKIVRN